MIPLSLSRAHAAIGSEMFFMLNQVLPLVQE
jgi:hypothetical protein